MSRAMPEDHDLSIWQNDPEPEDWTAPPKKDIATSPPVRHPWKVDIDPRGSMDAEGHYDDIRIYEVPERTPGLDTRARLVAKCQRREEAELIVYLYELHRKGVM